MAMVASSFASQIASLGRDPAVLLVAPGRRYWGSRHASIG
jgi:hypothetical protein